MFKRKGQNLAEYSILIAIVVAAAVAMQVYVRRGLQGRVADAVDHAPTTDNVANAPIVFDTKQYEPYYLEKESNISSQRDYTENVATRGKTDRTGLTETTTRGTGSYEQENWVGFDVNTYDKGR
jgi:hypothetical protein